MQNQKHEFAIFYELLDCIQENETLSVTDEHIYHRLIRVLRLNIDDTIIIFNNKFNLLSKIVEISKKGIVFKVLKSKTNESLIPSITIVISLLKKEAFEDAIYLATELGATSIQPIITQKSQQKKLNPKDYERLNKIIVSAAEQSKNFNLPILKEILTFKEFLGTIKTLDIKKFLFDPQGENIFKILNDQFKMEKSNIFLMIGPEGDLTVEEKKMLYQSGFVSACLTPTILRAQTSIGLSIGIVRSFFNKK